MELYKKEALSGMSLQAGLFVVCFLFVLCALTGCGHGGQLLSGLRQEEAGVGNEAVEEGAGERQEGVDVAQDVEQGVGNGQNAKRALDDGNAQSAKQGLNDRNGQNAKQAADGKTAENLVKEKNIYVHVCGAVKSPGVYELPEGSRFFDAVEMAGGFAEGAFQDYLNMAASLADGSRLEIPTKEEIERREKAEKDIGKPAESGKEKYEYYTVSNETAASTGNQESSGAASNGLVNINTADMARLCALPGIGEGRAKAIIEYREKQGGFQKKEDIMQVSGIGEKMYARMEAYLTVE